MRIKSVEITGFKGVAEKARFNFDAANFSPVLFDAKEQTALLIYKAVFGIIFGFTEEQKKRFRSENKAIGTFTGLVEIQLDNEEYLIERDFETDFVACVALRGSRMHTIYQGKDIITNGSHKAYLGTIKNYAPQLIESINHAFKQIATLKAGHKVAPSAEQTRSAESPHSNIYFLKVESSAAPERKNNVLLEKYPHLFYEIFNKANDAIFLWKLNSDLTPGRCIEANRAACELTGYSLSELRMMTFLDLKPKLERERILDLMQQLISRGRLSLETVNLTKDGREVFVEINAHTFYIEDQRVILSVTRDISQKKHFEEEILKSNIKYRALFENASDAIFLLDRTKIIDCNQTALNLLKVEKKNLVGKAFVDICHKIRTTGSSQNKEKTLKNILEIVYAGRKKSFNCTFFSKDRQKIEAEARLELLDLRGQKYVQVIIKDLTKIKETQRALLKKNLQYQNFIQNSLVGIWYVEFKNPISVKLPAREIAKKIFYEGRFVEVNDALVKMYRKKSAKEIIGQPPSVFSIDHQKSLKNLTEFVQNDFRMELKETVEKAGDKKQSYFNNSYFGHVEDGALQWMWGLQIDVTHQKELEEQFLHSQKMEAIGMLAGGIAHDFNNILTVINGYADMLSRRMKADDPLFKYIAQIRQAGEKASNLTSQLLAFSRKQVFQTRSINLNQLIKGMISMVQRIIGEHIEIVTRLSSDLRAIRFDENKIEQIILNMAVNAKDAMPRGGKLFLETRNVTLDAAYCAKRPEFREGEYVLLTISDTGVGIEKETLKHIFEPFFTTKEKGMGTGLGLATVYGIVKQANGYITVQSQVGQGTTFSIYFPTINKMEVILEKDDDDDLILFDDLRGNETILVVEDDATVRQVIVETLHNYGYRVLEAMDGAEALEIFALSADQIDLIVSDIVMPRVNGIEFHLRILKTNPLVKFIFISGYSNVEILKDADLNSVEFVQKPFKLQELVRRVRKVLNYSRESLPTD
ncbi:PAS/PAC sensor hybrid histidine kinase [Caldithrix abyssi DSM 13497]|uniref:histidine kinase n=1 Tax=Caldithrix abyssi DSM 13497 TaxID=880073 RepID=H1XXQ7_CALAY|nr:PAS domain-containing sensor histidine kinase [Caldithrix abyssi]APF19608.1 PAS domain S-box-containing protein [Caldithrix abyssi DSM 13497]EHO39730.1 PAS/PAC sensor hybrid histidine kinase [Caldithrix abyssi DSM 13497]